MSGRGFIRAEGKLKCSDCGKLEELRPYGKDNALICFSCMKKDEPAALQRFSQFVFGHDYLPVKDPTK